MKIVELIRLETSLSGTFGIVRVDKEIICVSLEPPDLFNQKNISCIPVSQYSACPYNSERFGDTYQIMNVPKRSGILFHQGNYVDDTSGCILLGKHIFNNEKGRAISNSLDTLNRFKYIIGKDSFHLTIIENF